MDWVCPSCGFLNVGSKDSCEFCLTKRDNIQVSAQNPLHRGDEGASPMTANAETLKAPDSAGGQAPDMAAASNTSDGTMLVLTEIRSKTRIEIPCDGIVGREADFESETFTDRVSRQQIEVQRDEAGWRVRQVGTSNPTIVLAGKSRFALGSAFYTLRGDELLRMTNVTFRVAIEGAYEGPKEAAQGDAVPSTGVDIAVSQQSDDVVEGWFIDCPSCGISCLVADEQAHIDECPGCRDALDKRRIARVKPAYGERNKRVVSYVH